MKKRHFWFPIKSHIEQQQYKSKSRLSLIVRVNVVLNRTDISTTCALVIFRVKVSCITSVDGIILWLLMVIILWLLTLIPTLRPTLALLRQRLYRTSEAPLKLLHVYYNLTLVIVVTKSAPDLLTPCGCPCICHEPLKCSFRTRVSERNSQFLHFVSWVNENLHTCHA